MKNKKIYIIIIVLLIILNSISIYSKSIAKKSYEQTITSLHSYVTKSTFLDSYLEKNINYSQCKISDYEILDKNTNSLHLKDLFKTEANPIFILRFSDRYCSSCVEYFLDLFSKIDINENIRLVYMLGTETESHFIKELKDYALEEREVYNLDYFDKSIDNAGFPYLMVLNKDLVVENCYFPIKGYKKTDIEIINSIFDNYAKKLNKVK